LWPMPDVESKQVPQQLVREPLVPGNHVPGSPSLHGTGIASVNEPVIHALMCSTTRGGIYAMHARGKLPRPIGPGRRLIWRTADLLECRARRASSPEKGERR